MLLYFSTNFPKPICLLAETILSHAGLRGTLNWLLMVTCFERYKIIHMEEQYRTNSFEGKNIFSTSRKCPDHDIVTTFLHYWGFLILAIHKNICYSMNSSMPSNYGISEFTIKLNCPSHTKIFKKNSIIYFQAILTSGQFHPILELFQLFLYLHVSYLLFHED